MTYYQKNKKFLANSAFTQYRRTDNIKTYKFNDEFACMFNETSRTCIKAKAAVQDNGLEFLLQAMAQVRIFELIVNKLLKLNHFFFAFRILKCST